MIYTSGFCSPGILCMHNDTKLTVHDTLSFLFIRYGVAFLQ
jgi:hypothetical protein